MKIEMFLQKKRRENGHQYMGHRKVVIRSGALDASNALSSYETDIGSCREMGCYICIVYRQRNGQQLDMRLKDSSLFLLI